MLRYLKELAEKGSLLIDQALQLYKLEELLKAQSSAAAVTSKAASELVVQRQLRSFYLLWRLLLQMPCTWPSFFDLASCCSLSLGRASLRAAGSGRSQLHSDPR
jgi:hypothetical protein